MQSIKRLLAASPRCVANSRNVLLSKIVYRSVPDNVRFASSFMSRYYKVGTQGVLVRVCFIGGFNILFLSVNSM